MIKIVLNRSNKINNFNVCRRSCLKLKTELKFSKNSNSFNTNRLQKRSYVGLHDLRPYDFCVVGGGIVGLSVARELKRRQPHAAIAIVEKESQVGQHQSKWNSGVIHQGIYYKPGSQRAEFCRKGQAMMYEFLKEHRIPFKKCGKLIVAVKEEEIENLNALYEKAQMNGCDVEMLDSKQTIKMEPNLTNAIQSIYSPETGITDFNLVVQKLEQLLKKEKNVDFYYNFQVDQCIETASGWVIESDNTSKRIETQFLINCAGLFADQIAIMCGNDTYPAILPVRGEFRRISNEKIVKRMIYGVPDPKFPFLGVHLTPNLNGEIWSGPNAIVATDREGYNLFKWKLPHVLNMISLRGVQRLIMKNIGTGINELFMSFSDLKYYSKLKEYIPSLQKSELTKDFKAGVRAQAINENGSFLDDFALERHRTSLHVRNAPSPGATASLAIAEKIVDDIVY